MTKFTDAVERAVICLFFLFLVLLASSSGVALINVLPSSLWTYGVILSLALITTVTIGLYILWEMDGKKKDNPLAKEIEELETRLRHQISKNEKRRIQLSNAEEEIKTLEDDLDYHKHIIYKSKSERKQA